MTSQKLQLLVSRASQVLRAYGFNPSRVLHHSDNSRMAEDLEVCTSEGARAHITFDYRGENPRTTFVGILGLTPTIDPQDPRAD